jgi:RNA recognition motif-containing protein
LRWNSDIPNSNGSQDEPIAETFADEGNDSSIDAPVTKGYRRVNLREGENGEARGSQPRPVNPTKVIYVGNLKYETTEQELEERFSEFGEVKGVRIPRSSDQGVARGCVSYHISLGIM